jgi:hypothetical protein
MKIEHPMKLTFTLEEENSILTNTFVVDDCEQWTTLVIKFADFLSAQYGYEVKEKIAFISDFWIDDYSVVGERTMSTDAYSVAKGFDKERNTAQEEMDFDE